MNLFDSIFRINWKYFFWHGFHGFHCFVVGNKNSGT
jgi:hypothetical protein